MILTLYWHPGLVLVCAVPGVWAGDAIHTSTFPMQAEIAMLTFKSLEHEGNLVPVLYHGRRLYTSPTAMLERTTDLHEPEEHRHRVPQLVHTGENHVSGGLSARLAEPTPARLLNHGDKQHDGVHATDRTPSQRVHSSAQHLCAWRPSLILECPRALEARCELIREAMVYPRKCAPPALDAPQAVGVEQRPLRMVARVLRGDRECVARRGMYCGDVEAHRETERGGGLGGCGCALPLQVVHQRWRPLLLQLEREARAQRVDLVFRCELHGVRMCSTRGTGLARR